MWNQPAAPLSICLSFTLWIGAIVAAITELVMRQSIAPGGFVEAVSTRWVEVLVRSIAYAVLPMLSILLLSGRA
jgi:hypothetical protein